MDKQLIIAVDVATYQAAIDLANKLDPKLCRLKVGMQLFTAVGPKIVTDLMSLGFEIFLDLKFHDIPDTVFGAVKSAASLGVWMVNVHASGGREMLEKAANAVSGFQIPPIVTAVTVLTSMDNLTLNEINVANTSLEQVHSLAQLAWESGIDGVVCSGEEASFVRGSIANPFVIVTPGIRLPDGKQDDQKRIVTPEMAIQSGANYLVVGRPITGAADPIAALHDFNQRISLSTN